MKYPPEGELQTRPSPFVSTEIQAFPESDPLDDPQLRASLERLRKARTNLLSAAVAYCNGRISEGQLRAVRELMDEQRRRFEAQYGRDLTSRLADALRSEGGLFTKGPMAQPAGDAASSKPVPPASSHQPAADLGTARSSIPCRPGPTNVSPQWERPAVKPISTKAKAELEGRAQEEAASPPPPGSGMEARPLQPRTPARSAPAPASILHRYNGRLRAVDAKLSHLEKDHLNGRINTFQYRAIRRHFLKQRQAALRLLYNYHDSLRWEVVLEEGKTELLMELNQAACIGLAIYDNRTFRCLYFEGELPDAAQEALAFLGTFGSSRSESQQGLMYATHSEDGDTMLLIPGVFTSSLGVFSGDPPAWQARALREVHHNFEIANHQALERKDDKALIFPNLGHFIREQGKT